MKDTVDITPEQKEAILQKLTQKPFGYSPGTFDEITAYPIPDRSHHVFPVEGLLTAEQADAFNRLRFQSIHPGWVSMFFHSKTTTPCVGWVNLKTLRIERFFPMW